MPRLSARVRMALGGSAESSYTMHGSPGEIVDEIRRFEELGVDHLALAFPERDPEGLTRSVERFVSEVQALVEGAAA
jgi:alkanesulfonate monooxygenase SsuD/methylene tetrahydromethanopterin reductase-like flavin-dependent oxidoreductase (luciferase family)